MCTPVEDAGVDGGMSGGHAGGGDAGTAGGNAGGSAGGGSAGGSVAGGSVAGGSVAGGSVAGGSVAGGSVAGGSVAGGNVAGGNVAGGNVSGGMGGGGCAPCATWEQCLNGVCEARYSGIAVRSPPRTNQPLVVTASLNLIPGRLSNPIATLVLEATQIDAGRAVGSLALLGDGGYSGSLPLSSTPDGLWEVVASWPDAGLRGTSTTEVDTTAPRLRVMIPAAPTRVVFAGGLDFRDPLDAPNTSSWRRHDEVEVQVESDARDLDRLSVALRIGDAGFPVHACDAGMADSGASDAGAYCGVSRVQLAALALPGLRAEFTLTATAADELGNAGTVDAGRLTVSRWAFSFDGGSGINGFSVSPSGLLVVPNTATSLVSVIDPRGVLRSQFGTQYEPVRNVALMAARPTSGYLMHVLEYKVSNDYSKGESFDLSAGQKIGDWLAEGQRPGLQSNGPVTLSVQVPEDSVLALHRAGASWAGVRGSGIMGFGNSVSQTGSTSRLTVVAAGDRGYATNGSRVFQSETSTAGSFAGSEIIGRDPGPFSSISTIMANRQGMLFGLGVSDGGVRGFKAASILQLDPFVESIAEQTGAAVMDKDTIFFVRKFGSFSVVCGLSAIPSTPLVCSQANLQDQISGLAIGYQTVLSVAARAPSGATFLQVRDMNLVLSYEISMPGVTGDCTALTLACSGGRSVLMCIDTVGRIAGVYSDQQQDPNASWPMEAHDPARTQNGSTSLTVFNCP